MYLWCSSFPYGNSLTGAGGIFTHPGSMSLSAAEPALPAPPCPRRLTLWVIIWGFFCVFQKQTLIKSCPFACWFKQTNKNHTDIVFVCFSGAGWGRNCTQGYIPNLCQKSHTREFHLSRLHIGHSACFSPKYSFWFGCKQRQSKALLKFLSLVYFFCRQNNEI